MKNVTRWNSQLVMLQSVLKDHKEVNTALALIQSPNRITNQDYLALNELVRVLLPFKKPMQQIEGKNFVTSSSICPVVIGLVKAMEQLKNANLNYCKKLATALHDSVLKRLLPFLNCMDNRLTSLLHPRFKQKWIENDDEKEEALRVLQIQQYKSTVQYKTTVQYSTRLQIQQYKYNRGRKPMAREPGVALLITASGSFVDKHKLPHIKKKICAHKISKVKTLF